MSQKYAIVIAEFDSGGGPYKNMLRITRALLEQGFAVEVFPCAPGYPDLTELEKKSSSLHINHKFVQPYPRARLLRIAHYFLESWSLARWLRKATAKVSAHDLIVVFSITSPGRFLWRYGRPVRPIYIFRSNPEGKLHKLMGPLCRRFLSTRARVVGVSESTKNQFVETWKLDPGDSRLSVLRNSAAAEGLTPAHFENSVKQILMVGRLHPNKNPLLWLEVAMHVLKNCSEPVHFVWLGDGPIRQEAERYSAELGIADRVHFRGFVSEPYQYYQSSYVYLHLPSVEPMANAVIDAMCLGVPPVVSRIGGNTEIVRDGHDGLVVSLWDPREIALTVVELLSHTELHSKLSENARNTYRDRFASSRWAREFTALLEPSSRNQK